jgi:hypothetical protein
MEISTTPAQKCLELKDHHTIGVAHIMDQDTMVLAMDKEEVAVEESTAHLWLERRIMFLSVVKVSEPMALLNHNQLELKVQMSLPLTKLLSNKICKIQWKLLSKPFLVTKIFRTR